jgi:hypothetical protein
MSRQQWIAHCKTFFEALKDVKKNKKLFVETAQLAEAIWQCRERLKLMPRQEYERLTDEKSLSLKQVLDNLRLLEEYVTFDNISDMIYSVSSKK